MSTSIIGASSNPKSGKQYDEIMPKTKRTQRQKISTNCGKERYDYFGKTGDEKPSDTEKSEKRGNRSKGRKRDMGDKKEQGGEQSTSRGRGAQGQNLKPHAKKNVHSFNRINRISSVTEVGLHCVYTNMDCFLNKRLEFQMFVTTEQPDIICLTEILPKHFNYSVQKVELEVDGYDCFCKIEETDARRGVVIYVKKGLKAQEINFSAYETVKDTVWVKLQLENGELLIGCIYRSPSNKEDMNDQLYKLVKNAIQGRTHILLTGDFNHPEIDWENETSLQNDNHKATIFLESVVRDNFLYQHVKSPTHYRAEQTPTLYT